MPVPTMSSPESVNGLQPDRLKVLRHKDLGLGRGRRDLLYERLQGVERWLLGRAIRGGEIVPVCRQHQGWEMQIAHQSPCSRRFLYATKQPQREPRRVS